MFRNAEIAFEKLGRLKLLSNDDAVSVLNSFKNSISGVFHFANSFIFHVRVVVLLILTHRFLQFLSLLKVSSRVKNRHFPKFAIFRRLNRAHQGLSSVKKTPGKNVFSVHTYRVQKFFLC